MFRADYWQAIKEDVTLQIGQGSARDAVSSYFFRLIFFIFETHISM